MVEYFYLSVASGSQRKTAKLMNYPYILINFMTQSNSGFGAVAMDCYSKEDVKGKEEVAEP